LFEGDSPAPHDDVKLPVGQALSQQRRSGPAADTPVVATPQTAMRTEARLALTVTFRQFIS
jgi:hypothetical protein